MRKDQKFYRLDPCQNHDGHVIGQPAPEPAEPVRELRPEGRTGRSSNVIPALRWGKVGKNMATEKAEKTITLTYKEISTLHCYILMTTKYREGEAEAWGKLAEETNPDKSPKFPHAASNAQFWREESEELERIMKKMID